MHVLRTQVGDRSEVAWLQAGGDLSKWKRSAGKLAATGRRQTVTTVTGYQGLLLGGPPVIDANEVYDQPASEWNRPADALRAGVTGGLSLQEAVLAAASKAVAAALADVTTAERGTAELIDEAEDRIVGWRRCLSPRACRWCAEVAAQRYGSAESAGAPNHDGNCHCSVIPIVGAIDPGQTINRGLRDALRSTDSAYVTDTGEPADRPDAKAPDTGD